MKESTQQERELPLALRAAYMSLHRNTDAEFDKHGVTADQFVLLLALSEGRALTQRELADRMSSDPSTVRAMLVLLEKLELVERACHPTDSRAKTVTLTMAGKRKLRKLWKVGQSIRDDMYGCLTPDEAETLISLLQKIACSLSPWKSPAWQTISADRERR
ncbi:putative HTH-type transcriptional regulator YusO [Rubripirellula lacrimiformis]|uniref:Putative HTH-type transcriptional regulator YusO n=1 Tax=Rubripirellula lacrimiformis TaxID=1930273 RepID=A0A517N5A8_9BACT|nr:MarR family transcriptional regulator [Rubripirellula lacrimiformis]QDT02329.1 putative HTH-type transcriptional regulator YusO [Rubripirellula lacrimiformis]